MIIFLLEFLPQLLLSKYHASWCFLILTALGFTLTSHNVMRCEYAYVKLELSSTLSNKNPK